MIIKHHQTFRLLLLTACLNLATQASGDVEIDSFDTYHELILSGAPAGPKSIFEAVTVGDVIGGERDVLLERTSANSGSISMDINASFSGALSFASSLNTSGSALMVYDGADAIAGINYTGLGGVDLTEGGINKGLFLGTTSDLGANVVFTVYTDETHYSRFSMFVGADISFTFDGYFAEFRNFSALGLDGGADYSNVGAITLLIDGTSNPSTDVGFDYFVATVPEPSGAFLIMSAGLVLMLNRRRYPRA
jgi:large repetitive protein